MNLWPPIVRIPFRAGPVLACTAKLTVPLPVPLAPLTIETQESLLDAVQLQEVALVTVTVPDPPAPPNDPVIAEVESGTTEPTGES